jgi:hypothetical protein
MAKKVDKLTEKIHELPDIENLRLVDVILKELDKPDRRSTGFGRWRHVNVGQRRRLVEPQRFLMNPSWRNTAAREGTL